MKKQLMLMVATCVWVPIASGGTVIISDGVFDDSDWSARSDASTIGASSGAQIPIGGDPGSYREIVNSGFNAGFVFLSTLGWHFYEADTYDPSSGAILSIDYSEDALRTQDPQQFGRLALRQDGFLFRSKQEFAIDGDPTSWMTYSMDDLGATDFEALFNGAFLPNANPDFSEAGSPITFGVYRRSTTSRGTFSSRVGLDNWRVVISIAEIPEPASVSICSLGLLSLAAFRRWRTNR